MPAQSQAYTYALAPVPPWHGWTGGPQDREPPRRAHTTQGQPQPWYPPGYTANGAGGGGGYDLASKIGADSKDNLYLGRRAHPVVIPPFNGPLDGKGYVHPLGTAARVDIVVRVVA